ncbi:MAG: taurine dioxygenase [Gammaproteobacteria bacterium]|jgi:taurine dioxygenase
MSTAARDTLNTRPLSPVMGAIVDDIDLSKPLDDASARALRELLAENSLLLFRNQHNLSPAAQVRFSALFGELEEHVLSQFCLPDQPQIFVVSNIVEEGRHIGAHGGSKTYHSDLAYLPEPSLGSVFRCIECPPRGGATAFISMFKVFDALSDERKRWLSERSVIFDYVWSYEGRFAGVRGPLTEAQKRAVPPLAQPCIRQHPQTGRPALYVSPTWVRRFSDLSEAESRPLLDDLMAFACQDRFAYYHQWSIGDVLVWDNRSSMHKVCDYDDQNTRRLMHRTTIKGDRPISWQAPT